MPALLLAIAIPLIILNFLAGIVGGIWLAILGEWEIIFLGIAYMVAGVFLISILLMPGLLFMAPLAAATERNRTFWMIVLGVPSLLWTYAILVGTCVGVFVYVGRGIEGPALPYLLWAYAVALAPWSFLAKKDAEAGNDYANLSVAAAQFGCISMGIAVLVNQFDVHALRLLFWMLPFAALGLAAQMFMVWVNTRAARGYYIGGEF